MRRVVALLAAVAALGAATASSTASAAGPRASLPDIEDEVMCPVCGVPLNIAESPQALREKAYIRARIAAGDTKQQIKDQLVAQFGREVLADPPDHGFDAANWLVPAGVVLAALAALALTVPRWRRRRATDGVADPEAPAPALDADDTRRLDDDLARFDT